MAQVARLSDVAAGLVLQRVRVLVGLQCLDHYMRLTVRIFALSCAYTFASS